MLLPLRKGSTELFTTLQMVYFNVANSSVRLRELRKALHMLLALRKGLRELCTTLQMLYFNVANSSESLENKICGILLEK